MRGLRKEQLKNVGVTAILDNMDVKTVYGRKILSEVKVYNSEKSLNEEFDLIDEISRIVAKDNIESQLGKILSRFKNINGTVKSLSISKTLDDVQLFELKLFMLLYENLKVLCVDIPLKFDGISFHKLIKRLDPEGQKLSSFSIYDVCDSRLNGIIARKRMIEHAISCGEGSMDERKEIVKEEKDQEQVILRELTFEFIPFVNDFLKAMDLVGKLDLLLAKISLNHQYNLVRPGFGEAILIEDGRHIVTELTLKARNRAFMPISVTLNHGVTFVTGANMGGKSVGLKTIMQCQMMAQYGFFVPAKKFTTKIMDYVGLINQDDQSIEKGLSTFGAEVIELKEIIDNTDMGFGLILLDELASGTNPKEAVKLVRATADYLSKKPAMTVITTHFDGVVNKGDCHYEVYGLKDFDFDNNYSFERRLDALNKHMDYRWIKATDSFAVPKDAINVSKWLGLQDEIVDGCKED